MPETKIRTSTLRQIAAGAAIVSLATLPNLLRAQQPVIVGELVRLQQTNYPAITIGTNSIGDTIRATKLSDGTESVIECYPNGEVKYYLAKTPIIAAGTADYIAVPNLNETVEVDGPSFQMQQAQSSPAAWTGLNIKPLFDFQFDPAPVQEAPPAANNPSSAAILGTWAAIYFGGMTAIVVIGVAAESLLRRMGFVSKPRPANNNVRQRDRPFRSERPDRDTGGYTPAQEVHRDSRGNLHSSWSASNSADNVYRDQEERMRNDRGY
jgi:hypothetical protein